jgi:hypothetical protein
MSNFVGDRSGQTLRLSVALQIVSQDRLALRTILEVHRADLDEDLELVPNEDITGDGNIAIGSLVLEGDLRLNAKNKRVPAKSGDDMLSRYSMSRRWPRREG